MNIGQNIIAVDFVGIGSIVVKTLFLERATQHVLLKEQLTFTIAHIQK